MSEQLTAENRLGTYLRNRRTKLDPSALGFPAERRRTSGLRREEVAQRASISPTWYTWLEQGRGGGPSPEVLDRIASALVLTEVEREHLFHLGLGRPPETRFKKDTGVTPRLQRVLDALEPAPALIRSALWDVVAWNKAATVMMVDFAELAPTGRNVLRFFFLDPRARAAQQDWDNMARFVVGAFRVDSPTQASTTPPRRGGSGTLPIRLNRHGEPSAGPGTRGQGRRSRREARRAQGAHP